MSELWIKTKTSELRENLLLRNIAVTRNAPVRVGAGIGIEDLGKLVRTKLTSSWNYDRSQMTYTLKSNAVGKVHLAEK